MTKLFWGVGAWVLAVLLGSSALAQEPQGPFVRLEDLDVDAARLKEFKAAARENAVTTLQREPGALASHATAEKDKPTRIRVFELYADAGAYQAHLRTPHFQRFRDATAKMVLARETYDAVPVLLGAKPRMPAKALVRIAELEIDPARLEAYTAAVTEEIEASIRVEPGVLAIYAVSLKERPNQLRFFEVYADEKAYLQHLASPHFKKYVDVTKTMIKSRKLFETEPLTLNAKPR